MNMLPTINPYGKLDIIAVNDESELLPLKTSQLIDFGATGVEEIYQNVKYILLTAYFSVVLDREFGMDFTMVDKPKPVAKIMLDQEAAMKIALYENRCYFEEIIYAPEGPDGKLEPAVKIRIVVTQRQ